MEQPKNNTTLIVIIAVVAVIVIAAIILAAYFYGKSKINSEVTATSSPTVTKTATSTPTPTATEEAQMAPKKAVENFMNYSIGTLPSANLNFDAARTLLVANLQSQFSDDNTFAAQFYGYQDGPTSVEITGENINGSSASVTVNANWGEMGLGWAFSLIKVGNQWLISDFSNTAQ